MGARWGPVGSGGARWGPVGPVKCLLTPYYRYATNDILIVTVIRACSSSVIVSEQHYKDVMENAASYNARLCIDRRLRLPFLDSQTGVAQNHSNLWRPYPYRGPGTELVMFGYAP